MSASLRFLRLRVIGAQVEPASPPVGGDGSTRAPMKARHARRTVCCVRFRELTPPGRDGPPHALRTIGWSGMAPVLASVNFGDPEPGVQGEGPLVILAVVAM